MTDLMERLRAADPVREDLAPPAVEQMLARLEDAAAPQSGEAGRRLGVTGRRRRSLVPAIVALVVVALVVGLQQRSTSPDVVAEARAALGAPGEIIHMVTRMDYTTTGVSKPDPALLRDREGNTLGQISNRTERWTALNPLRERTRYTIVPEGGGTPHTMDYTYADGVTEIRQSWDDNVVTNKLSEERYESVRGQLSPAQPGADPVAGVRQLLADGRLTTAGEETLDGRRVLRLVGKEPVTDADAAKGFPPATVEYLVDAETFAPVRFTYGDVISEDDRRAVGTLRRVVTFDVFERLPATPENEALLRQP